MLFFDVNIQGKKIELRAPKKEDVHGNWWQWFNDHEVTKYMNKGGEKNTPEKQLEFFEKISKSENDFVLAICDKESKVHIGTTGIHNIRSEGSKRIGNFGIIIGEKEYWGKGIGTESWFFIMKYAFENLKLDLIETKIFAENAASLAIAKKMGFKEISKDEIVKDGMTVDRIVLRLEKYDWDQRMRDVK